MRQCRKIYNNLLLMSVLFFTLGSVAHPHFCPDCSDGQHGIAEARSGGAPAGGVAYQDGRTFSGYASIHICGPVSDRVLLLPPGAAPSLSAGRAPGRMRPPTEAEPFARRDFTGPSRGPPDAGAFRSGTSEGSVFSQTYNP